MRQKEKPVQRPRKSLAPLDWKASVACPGESQPEGEFETRLERSTWPTMQGIIDQIKDFFPPKGSGKP